jgi:hypothetical protein
VIASYSKAKLRNRSRKKRNPERDADIKTLNNTGKR